MYKKASIILCILSFIASFVNGWAAYLTTNKISVILYAAAGGIWFCSGIFHLINSIKD